MACWYCCRYCDQILRVFVEIIIIIHINIINIILMTSKLRQLLGFDDVDIPKEKLHQQLQQRQKQQQEQQQRQQVATTTRAAANNDGNCQPTVTRLSVQRPAVPATRNPPAAATVAVSTGPNPAHRSVSL